MTANIAFALSAAVLSLAIVVGAALKGHWWVAAVYALLVAGFLARAAYGRARREPSELPGAGPEARREPSELPGAGPEARREPSELPGPGPEHEPERRLKAARFKRR